MNVENVWPGLVSVILLLDVLLTPGWTPGIESRITQSSGSSDLGSTFVSATAGAGFSGSGSASFLAFTSFSNSSACKQQFNLI